MLLYPPSLDGRGLGWGWVSWTIISRCYNLVPPPARGGEVTDRMYQQVISQFDMLYKTDWWLFLNLFCPPDKLVEKEMVASKTIKSYDDPLTPLCKSD